MLAHFPLDSATAYNMPPTAPAKSRVPRRTRLSSELPSPRHVRACARSLSTSSPRRCRSTGDVVANTNDSSVSRFADRELRLVEPKRVNAGVEDGDGRTHTPDSNRGQRPGDEMPVREDRIPLAWYVQPWRSHSLSSTAARASEPWGHSLPAARTALMNRRSKSV